MVERSVTMLRLILPDRSAWSRLLAQLRALPFGKRLPDAVYFHRDGLATAAADLVAELDTLAANVGVTAPWNVVKFATSRPQVSFLVYPDFFDTPHPALSQSFAVDVATGRMSWRGYDNAETTPILHRKEVLLHPEHPRQCEYKALTAQEEREGLYADAKRIGQRGFWDDLLLARGLSYRGHLLLGASPRESSVASRGAGQGSCETTLSPPEAEVSTSSAVLAAENMGAIERHRTAIARASFSRPVRAMLEYNILREGDALFDYGCGLGDDVRGLQMLGYRATGWDPVHRPDETRVEADVVNLGFVLNVIEVPAERLEVLRSAWALARRTLVVTGLIARSTVDSAGTPFGDGIRTSRNTFQKYFLQNELQELIDTTLGVTSVPIGIGVFAVFRHEAEFEEFLASRQRIAIAAPRLRLPSERRLPRPEAGVKQVYSLIDPAVRSTLERFWQRLIDLGRLPEEDEFSDYDALRRFVGSPKRALKIVLADQGEQPLLEAAERRRQEVLVFLALGIFRRIKKLTALPKRMQRDIKAFCGSFKDALEAARQLLFKAGDVDTVATLCEQTVDGGLGWADHKALYVHRDLVLRLPAVLRIYVGCGLVLFGELDEVDIVKIHKFSGKLTLLRYDDYLRNPLPELLERTKIKLRERRMDVFDHGNSERIQILYYKERYLARDDLRQVEWGAFSRELRQFGLTEAVGFGPWKDEFWARVAVVLAECDVGAWVDGADEVPSGG